jgi:uncharacterized membrane protein YeaQ/YmgE (transglycosylase-associated protein family)
VEILVAVLFGLVAGSVARRVMPGPRAGGIVVAVLAGMGGALLGGFIGAASADGRSTGFDPRIVMMGISGALILLLCYRSFALRMSD